MSKKIFYIIEVAPNGDETVLSDTYESSDAAWKHVDEIEDKRDKVKVDHYRVDATLSDLERKWLRSKGLRPAIAGMPVQEQRPNFTSEELFSDKGVEFDGRLYFCMECGSVAHSREVHTSWHNKLLP